MKSAQAWWKRYWRHASSAAAIGCGVGTTIWLGVLGAADEPLSRDTAALLVLASGAFQVVGGSLVHSIGKADPGLARAAVRRLIGQTNRAQRAEHLAQEAFEQGGVAELRRAMGQVSVHLSYLAEGAVEAIADWHEFHGRALEGLVAEGEPDDGQD